MKGSKASVVASVQPYLALWPVANGPELMTSTGKHRGIASAFSNPLQRIREDFRTFRLDEAIAERDSITCVCTIDDSAANTPTANPLSLVKITLREQVASLNEAHRFSPNVLNQATFTNLQGFLKGAASTLTVTPTSTLLGWRSLEDAFFIEDVIKPKPSFEVRLGFRQESTAAGTKLTAAPRTTARI